MVISVVIPNYNGVELLRSNLPSAVESLQKSGEPYEIIVIDDCSSDTSVAFLRDRYPNVRVIVNERNYGFARTCNVGIGAAKGEYTCVVNTDVEFTAQYFTNVLALLRSSRAFAVLGDIQNFIDGHWDINRTAGVMTFKRGLFRFSSGGDINPDRFGWHSGDQFLALGCCFVARTKELKNLGGFNEIFVPFYWEDVDLCIRAFKAGFKVQYCYDCPVVHYASGTIGRTRTRIKRRLISQRNKFLFTWMHMATQEQKLLHAWYLLYSVLLRWVVLDWKFYVSLFTATIRYMQCRDKVWSVLRPSPTAGTKV